MVCSCLSILNETMTSTFPRMVRRDRIPATTAKMVVSRTEYPSLDVPIVAAVPFIMARDMS